MPLSVFLCMWIMLNFWPSVLLEEDDGGYTIANKVRFPFSKFYDPFMGILVAFDLKLVPSEIDTDFSWNIEANYFLPQNETEYTYPPIVSSESSEERGLFDRATLYKIIEMKMDSFTKQYGGGNCFLRIICDMSRYTTKDTDILGDLMHIILSPSSSLNTNLPLKYTNAESYGKKNKHCKKYNKKCPLDIVNSFTVIGDLLDNTFLG